MGIRSIRTTIGEVKKSIFACLLLSILTLISCTKLSQFESRNPASQNSSSSLETQLKKHEKADELSSSDETSKESQKEKPESNNN